jgi:hypothetical protein
MMTLCAKMLISWLMLVVINVRVSDHDGAAAMVEILDPCTCESLSAPHATVNGVAAMPLNSNSGCILVKVTANSASLPLCRRYSLPTPNNTIDWMHSRTEGRRYTGTILASDGSSLQTNQRDDAVKNQAARKPVKSAAAHSIASDSVFPEYDGKTSPIPRRIRIPFADEITQTPLPVASDIRHN